MAKNMDIILKTEEKPEVDKITEMLRSLDDGEKGKMLIFMQGVKFAKETAAIN